MGLIVALAADHGGFFLKEEIKRRLHGSYELLDLGARALVANDDYPDYAFALAEAVASGKAQRGILICGSGVGAAMAANKVAGVRAGLCHDTYSAHQGVEHDDINILALGARVIGIELAVELATVFLKARFTGEERHRHRLEKVRDIERRQRSA